MMDVNEEFWNPISFNEQTSAQSNGSNATDLDSGSLDNYSNPVDCEVVMDTDDSQSGIVKNIRQTVRSNHHRKYFQVTKKDLTAMINRNDKSVVIKENSSRKPELVYNYRRVCIGEKETEFVKCIHCNELLCYSSYDGTTSVTRHLTSCTKLNEVNFKPYETEMTKKSNNYTPGKVVVITSNKPNTIGKKSVIQKNNNSKMNQIIIVPKSNTSFQSTCKPAKQPRLDTSSLKDEFSRSAIDAIVTSMLPIDFFDTISIKNYLQKLIAVGADYGNVDIKAILPTSEETKKAFSEMMIKIEKNIKQDFDELNSITLLIDEYACKLRGERFVVLACQYSNDGTLKNRVLGLKQFNELNFRQKEFQEILNTYGLDCKKKINLVSSSNPIDNFREEFCCRLSWWNCSINQLNQTLDAMVDRVASEPSVKEIAHFVEKCPSIYHYFNSLSNITQNDSSMKMITDANDTLHSNNYNLSSNNLNENEITHEMIFKVLNILKEKEHTIYDDHNLASIIGQVDLTMLGKVRLILNNFYDAKKFISIENNITFNLVLPCFKKLTMICKSDDEPDYRIKSFKFLLNTLLEEHFCVSDEHKIATFLTPKFRSMRNLCTTEELNTLMEKIEKQLKQEKDDIKREEDNFFEFCKTDAIDMRCDDIDLYLKQSLTNQDVCDDPLKFWKRNEELFPKLSKYAIALLSIPASSAGYTTKLFTQTDLINLSKRIPIQKRLNDFLFINSNLDLVNSS